MASEGSRFAVKALYEANGIHLATKSDSWLLRALRPMLGQRWWERMAVTIGSTVYLPDHIEDPWDYEQLLRHEAIHVFQFRRWGVLFWLTYLLLPLPAGLAWFRWRWEREAYLTSEIMGAAPHNRDRMAQWVASLMWSPNYFWAWPSSWALKWLRKEIKKREGRA